MLKNLAVVILLISCVLLVATGCESKPFLLTDRQVRGFTGHLCVATDDTVFVGLKDGTIRQYDLELDNLLAEIPRFGMAGTKNMSISPDGSRLTVVRSNGSLDIIDLSSRRLIKNLQAGNFSICMGVFSTDGRRNIVYVDSDYDKTRRDWNRPEEGNLWVYSSQDAGLLSKEATPVLSGRWQEIDWEENIVAVGEAYDEGGRGVLLWDIENHKKMATLLHPEFQCGPLSVALSPDASKVAVGYAPYDVAIWDVQTGKIIHDLASRNNWVVCLAWTHDGKLLASGEGNSAVRVWDVEAGKQLFMLPVGRQDFSNYTYSVAFDSTGEHLICGAADGHVRVWQLPGISLTTAFP